MTNTKGETLRDHVELRPQYGLVRITGGNFRLVDRLLTQVRRIQTLHHFDTLTPEIVDAARETLLIGH
jgi:hypothetical protein